MFGFFQSKKINLAKEFDNTVKENVTKTYLAFQYISPNLVVWALCWQCLKQTICIKNDVTHYGMVFACVPFPIG